MDASKANRWRSDLNALAGSSPGVTLGELARWSETPVRTIRQWLHEELLPTPIRKADASGYSRSYFPPLAIPAARRLATFRRYVTTTRDAKAWLALEGFTYLSLADADLEARLRDWHTALWEQTRRACQFRDRVDEAAADDEVKDDILDDLDRAVRQPLQERYPVVVAEAGTSIVAMILGVAEGTDVEEWCRLAQEDYPEGRRLLSFIEATLKLFEQVSGMPNPRHLTVSPEEDGYLTAQLAVLLPRWRELPPHLDWARIRLAWRMICSTTDPWLAAPETAPDSPTDFGCQWRRLCYRNPPEFTLLALATITANPFWTGLGVSPPSGPVQQITGDGTRPDLTKVPNLPRAQTN